MSDDHEIEPIDWDFKDLSDEAYLAKIDKLLVATGYYENDSDDDEDGDWDGDVFIGRHISPAEHFETFLGHLEPAWAYVLEHQRDIVRLLAPPRLMPLRSRNDTVASLLNNRLANMRYEFQESCPERLATLDVVPWFRYHLMEVLYDLTAKESDIKHAIPLLVQVNARMKAQGLADATGLLPALNIYLGVKPDKPTCENGVMLITEIPGGGDKDRDRVLLKRYEPLTQPMALATIALSAQEIAMDLDQEFPWMTAVTHRICAQIEEQQRYGVSAALLGQPILLVGSPGSGKTYYAQRLAALIRVPTRLLSIGGMADNIMLKGNARNWTASRPSMIAEFIAEKGCPNPVLILDELEKAGISKNNGNVYDTLIQLFETQNSAQFFDEHLLAAVDLSRVSYLATANSIETLPDPLKDRMLIWHVPSPEPEHLVAVAHQLWWRHWASLDVPVSVAPAPDSELLERALAEAVSIRQVKTIVDVLLRMAKKSAPIVRVH